MNQKQIKRQITTDEYVYHRDEDGKWTKQSAEYGNESFKLIPSEISLCEYCVTMQDEYQKYIDSNIHAG